MDFLNKVDRQKLQKITLIVISALTLIALVLLLVIIISSVEGNSNNTNASVGDILTGIEMEDKEVSGTDLNKGSLLLVNSEHPYTMPSDVNLVNLAIFRNEHNTSDIRIPYSIGDINLFQLCSNAVDHSHNMLMELLDDTGNDSIMISAAYGKEDAKSDVHAGYTIVLTVSGAIDPYLSHESNEKLNNWLVKNAHKHGFVIRYPDNKAEITGVADYNYAYRYVGVAHASYMTEKGLCLEEYIDFLKENTSANKTLNITAADGHTYAIYYSACSNDTATVKVPVQTANPDGSTAYSYTISGTNEGGVVVTIQVK